MQAITVKFYGPTNATGSKYVARSASGVSASVQSDDALSADANRDAAALALCKKLGWSGSMVSGGLNSKGDTVYVFVTPGNRVVAYPAKATMDRIVREAGE